MPTPYQHFEMEGLHLLKFAERENSICNVDLKNQCNVDLLRSPAPKLKEICPISVGWSVKDVPLPMFRCGTSSKDLYRTSGTSSSYSESNQHQNHYLLTRHATFS